MQLFEDRDESKAAAGGNMLKHSSVTEHLGLHLRNVVDLTILIQCFSTV